MTKFSEELITAELAVLCFVSTLAVYLLLIRKKKKESAEWVPAVIVRAYLDRVRSEEAEVRFKLFGEASAPVSTHAPLTTALNSVATVTDPALLKEVDALRAQLSASDQRAMEFDRMMAALRAEKAALEEKLKAAPAAAGAAAGAAAAAPSPEALKELEDLKAKLQEYEVIEDDLANLKKFQKENEQLRQKVEQYEKGGAVTAVSGTPAEPETKTVVSGAPEKTAPTMTLVSGGGAPAAEAAPAAAAAPAPAPVAPEANTNVLAAEQPAATEAPAAAAPAAEAAAAPAAAAEAPAAAAAPAAEEKSSKQKEEELLSEFEKMLAS